MNYTDASLFPGFRQNEDGTLSLSLDNPKPMAEPKIVTDRIYLISRGNIDLEEAQKITLHAALEHPEYGDYLAPEKRVDLVWCSAYPDAIFGKEELQYLLISYVQQTEGERYLKADSRFIPIKGTKDGYDYYIMILVHVEG